MLLADGGWSYLLIGCLCIVMLLVVTSTPTFSLFSTSLYYITLYKYKVYFCE